MEKTTTEHKILSYLFVPATKRAFIDRVLKDDHWHPDWLIFDFEDAVRDVYDAENEGSLKICARDTLASYLPFPDSVARKYVLRINSVNSPAFEADLDFLARTREFAPKAVVLPKVESPQHIASLEKHLPKGVAIIPLIESAQGVKNVDSILEASDRIRSFCFGHVDYFFEAGVFPIPRSVLESKELEGLIESLIEAARKHGKQYIDMGFYYRGRWDDLNRHCLFLAYQARGDVELGKLVMHPDQISHLKEIALLPPKDNPLAGLEVAKPSSESVTEYARQVVEAYDGRPDKTSSVCLAGDAIVTTQIYLLARKYLKNVK